MKRTPVDDDTLRGWIAACDPYAPLEPGDPRYFDFNQPGPGGEPPLRGKDHTACLRDAVELSGDSSCQLFSGFSGTGKSTELRRLASELEAGGYAVLLVSGQDYHDLSHRLTIEDLIVMIAGALGEATAARLGSPQLRPRFWERLRDFVTRLEVDKVGLTLVPEVADLKLGLRSERPFWVQIREALNRAPMRLRDFCQDYVRECVAQIQRAESGCRGVVFILDSMEKLNALPPDFRGLMESVFRVLINFPDFLRLPGCHAIYTVPPYVTLINPALMERYRVEHVLPAIKVLQRGVALLPFRLGVDALAELVARRIEVDRVFGDQRDLLERLIVASAGHVRTLIVFLRELLFQARRRGLPPTEEEIEAVVQPFREQARMRVWKESAPLLQRILEEQTITGIQEGEFETVARFMDNYLVLCYRNGEDWYEVHPLVRDHVVRLAAQFRKAGETESP